MWTNVFKIGGLHQITWFQFLPSESDLSSLPEKSVKAEQKDAATLLVLVSHLQLQKEGFFSTWTNSFVGPWDPSQGVHNPDEKIKLWLFLPGRHSSVPETVQAAVSRLRVVGSGLWVAPGESEEVAVALSQALRNCIERALRGISYMRYGDVFTRCHPFLQSGKHSRRVQPAIEFIFAATEEAIFVHVIISAKHIRTLSSDDMEKVLGHRSSQKLGEKLPVIVAPHGMRGKLSGCCPSDLVKQVYFSSSKSKPSNGLTVLNIPSNVAQASGCQLRGQTCYVEVTLGCPGTGDKAVRLNPNNPPNYHHSGSPSVAQERDDQKHESSLDQFRVFERTFIYPAEAVVVPVIQTAFARSSLKRFWLQSWTGASLFGSCFLMNCSGFGRSGNEESISGPWMDSNGIRSQHSSSNSNNSSISSISSTSSESDHQMTSGGGDFEADADSLTCRQAGLFSNDQHENGDHKQVSKRPRTGTSGSFGGGTVINATVEINSANDQVRSFWDWDSEEKGEMDIQILLSDFGDFGDFFENDTLPFGEPPGTAESQAIVYSVLDCGDVNGSPCTVAMDVTDQMLLPGLDFPSFDSLNPLPMAVSDESQSKQQKVMKDAWSSVPANYSSALSAGECDTLSKAEAVMTFAPEYTAVETPSSELLAQTFRCPYLPISRKVESSNSSSNAYLYGATPPSSCLTGTEEKPGLSQHAKSCSDGHESGPAMNNKKYYTYVRWGKGQSDGKLIDYKSNMTSTEGLRQSSAFSGFSSKNAVKSVKRERTESNTEPKNIFLSLEIVFASEVECILFQASMCRIRHMLVSSSNLVPVGLSSITGNTTLEHLRGDTFTVSDKTSSRFEVKKKESIPIRIAGDVDGGMLDGSLNAPIGVWRSVGVPKGGKPTSSLGIDNNPSFHHNSFSEENRLMYGQRQPLQELLDAMVLLVQQATSFVDVALDAEYGDGPFGWLALEEQCRRGFSCGPSMVHAGCGGLLASCHSLDIAGVELLDPLSANVHASSVIGLLHSDIKVALKSAFGILDGPLLVTDWCKGRSQLGDTGNPNDGYSGESASGDAKDSSSAITLAVGEPISPTNSSGSSCLRDGVRVDETSQRRLNQESGCSDSEQQMNFSRLRPTLLVLPMPSILVGYQDDWLKTSASAIQLWDKAPLEPYALPKPMTYYVVCPDIDPLASAAADFFQQLGTVYETCKLGTHIPQNLGAQMELSSGKWASSGFVMIDCPQSMKIESGKASIMGSISDYLLALSNAWDMRSFLKSLSNVIKSLRLGSNSTANQKEGSSGPCMVIYVVCPFPEPVAVLQTMIESSVALGSTIVSSDKEKRSSLHIQVGRALSSSAAVDEASLSNFPTLSGFSLPKLVLQIVTVEAILRVTSPALNELVLLKEISFTVYNKSRRLSRASSNDAIHAPGISVRPQSTLMPMTSPISGMWKDCIAPRITGSLPREGELDTNMRGAWDNNWQASRTGGLNYDQNRLGDKNIQDDVRYLFEPLFILAEPGSVEQGVSPPILGNAILDSYRSSVDDGNSGFFLQNSTSVGADIGSSSLLDGSNSDGFGHGQQKTTSLHCCYGWTEDWRWLVCVWTDSRGEFLDSQIFPFGGIGSRQDTKGLHCLFVQVLHQSCQILSSSSPDSGSIKPRDIIIARIGSFYELERQEWQKAIYLVGGNEVKKWPLQLRRSVPDGISPSNGSSLHQQEMSLIQERTLPSSSNPAMYNTQTKSSGFMKGGLGQLNARKQLGGSATVDSSRGLFQWVQSISLVGVSVDHSLHLILQADTSSPGGGGQGASGPGPLGYLEGYSPVKSLGSTSTSYILIPSPSMHFLPPTPLQLPMCLTSESPPLAHLLHSKGSAIPLSTGFVVSKAVPSILKDTRSNMKEEWPSVLSVGLVDYYGSSNIPPEKIVRGSIKHGRSLNTDVRDHEIETHLLLESVAAELHALSWMTASPAYLERRTALPFHCDMILRLRRLIHYADREICQKQDKVQM